MNWDFLKPVVAGQLRHIAGTLGGILIGVGAMQKSDEGAFENIVAGIGMWGIAAAWSWWQKVGEARVLAVLRSAKRAIVAPAQTVQK